VHDAYHIFQYSDFLARMKCAVPKDVYCGVEAERQAISYQQKVMRGLSAPPKELDWLSRQDGWHFDTNRDGEYDWIDYDLRDW